MKHPHRSSLWNLRKAVSPTAIHLPAAPTGSTTTKMCYLCTRFSCHPSPRSFKLEFEGVGPLECSPPARQRRVHRRCLASRLDVVLNVMSACLASSRGSASPEHKHGRAHGYGQSRGRRPRTAGDPGSESGQKNARALGPGVCWLLIGSMTTRGQRGSRGGSLRGRPWSSCRQSACTRRTMWHSSGTEAYPTPC